MVKVIFIEDVSGVARVGQTRVVADGYARNFLFPRRLAVLAGSQAAAAINAQLQKKIKQRAMEEAEMTELAKRISGLEITLKAKVGENDKLYGSITGTDITEALNKAAGCEIDKRKIELLEPIKQAGVCDVTVKLAHEISAVIKVNVVSEEAVDEKPEKKEKKAKKEKSALVEKPAEYVKEEKAEKKERKEKPEKSPKEAREEKPSKEKKAKKAKAEEEEKPVAEEKPAVAEKKEKKPRTKTKKTESIEAKKESSSGE